LIIIPAAPYRCAEAGLTIIAQPGFDGNSGRSTSGSQVHRTQRCCWWTALRLSTMLHRSGIVRIESVRPPATDTGYACTLDPPICRGVCDHAKAHRLRLAMKRLPRSKANFGIHEGFLSELLREDVETMEVLESASNRDAANDRSNRLDLKVRNRRGELALIEVQYERQHDYLSRMLYGSAKTRVEHLDAGQPYADLVKVVSVNILYFDLVHGKDYIYHGTMRFHGLHKHDELALSLAQRQLFPGREGTHELFPEYYPIKVERFDDIARDTLDEWVYFLKHEAIRGGSRPRA
jgi:hypothetical protein